MTPCASERRRIEPLSAASSRSVQYTARSALPVVTALPAAAYSVESYLAEFPHGAHAEEAHEALVAADSACVQAAAERRARFRDCDDCPVMSVIPGGEYMMGSSGDRDPDSEDSERPKHKVIIPGPSAVNVN